MINNLTPSVLGFITIAFLISACGSTKTEQVKPIEVKTIEIPRPAPIVPGVDQLKLREVQWIIITPENVDQKFKEIEGGELVLFALTTEGYENIALNMSDVRAMIDQQAKIIAVYKNSYKP
jgi:hypothetical protein